ncbi:MAG: zf-HC2 domain-containing protein [Acidobacteriia bacterium]|nr:zf-HC2 domain-containing protein [Terriglobia bacterium]
MGCVHFEERISTYLDGMLDAREQEGVLAHLHICQPCNARWHAMKDMRARLRRLELPQVPPVLAVQLRVLASHEHARRLSRGSLRTRLRTWKDSILLDFENLMRPVALPVAGGVLSAMLLFGALIPTLIFPHHVTNDAPLSFTAGPGELYIELAITGDRGVKLVNWIGEAPRLAPVDTVISSDENVLELTIDNEGHIADYAVRQGRFTPEMLTIIQFSTFTPAMFFGKPTWGKTLVVLPSHRRYSARG